MKGHACIFQVLISLSMALAKRDHIIIKNPGSAEFKTLPPEEQPRPIPVHIPQIPVPYPGMPRPVPIFQPPKSVPYISKELPLQDMSEPGIKTGMQRIPIPAPNEGSRKVQVLVQPFYISGLVPDKRYHKHKILYKHKKQQHATSSSSSDISSSESDSDEKYEKEKRKVKKYGIKRRLHRKS